jgi:ketosteroid isomerase-like protein
MSEQSVDASVGATGAGVDHPLVPLVARAYEALGRGDAPALLALLGDDFVGTAAEGLPAPIGGRHEGGQAMVDDCWWAIGRRFRVRVHPQEWIPATDGRLLVIGRYRGRHRDADIPVDADFAHLWTGDGDHLTALHQFTDTVAWGL